MNDWKSIFFIGIGCSLLAIMVHALIMNVIVVKKQLKTLLLVLLITTCLLYAILIIMGMYNFYEVLLTLAILGAYIQTYPALLEDIPTIRILRIISLTNGITIEDLTRKLTARNNLQDSKENELENDGFVEKSSGKYTLTTSGFILANFFYWYRKIFNISKSNG